MASSDAVPYHMQEESRKSEDTDETEPTSGTAASLSNSNLRTLDDASAETIPGARMSPLLMLRVSSQSKSGSEYSTYKTDGQGLASSANIEEDGRISIRLDLANHLHDLPKDYALPVREYATDPSTSAKTPALNIVIMIVGSRGDPNNVCSVTLPNVFLGDVQPFIVLANGLKKHGHRVRLATHETFRQMVTGAGHEFFPIGGDPAELMSFMVKSRRIILAHICGLTDLSLCRPWAAPRMGIANKWRHSAQAEND